MITIHSIKPSKVASLLVSCLIVLYISIQSLSSQALVRCGTSEKMQSFYEANPDFLRQIDASRKNNKFANKKSSQAVKTIPVHVIVLHSPDEEVGEGNNISAEHIQSQIDVLNEDFRALNLDIIRVPADFPTSDAMIEFCLAKRDPDGNNTDGITRYSANQNIESSETQIKNATTWDHKRYLNIWVAPKLGGLLGYAYFPTETYIPGRDRDGVVVLTAAFGNEAFSTSNQYNLGRTVTHEIGHYLGIDHPWGPQMESCSMDDGFDDTPLQYDANSGCPTHPSISCGNFGDMFMNYMDYSDDSCLNAFTPEQTSYMNLILSTSRSALVAHGEVACTPNYPVLNISAVQIDTANCYGDGNGAIQIMGSGGVGGYTFALDQNEEFTSDSIFTNQSAGSHIIYIKDEVDQIVQDTIQIFEPDLLQIMILDVKPVCPEDSLSGAVLLGAAGGKLGDTDTYQFSINDLKYFDTNVFDQIGVGDHRFYVLDSNGCKDSIEINIPMAEVNDFMLEVDSISCNGFNDAKIQIAVIGEADTYRYYIDDVEIAPPLGLWKSVDVGQHTISTVDSNLCRVNKDILIEDPEVLDIKLLTFTDSICMGGQGQISIEGIGGRMPYILKLNESVIEADSVYIINVGSNVVTIEDMEGCTSTQTYVVQEYPELEIEVIYSDLVICPNTNGHIQINATGGSGKYEYVLGGVIYRSGGYFEYLRPGNEFIEVIDLITGCKTTYEFEIIELDSVHIDSLSVTPVPCYGEDTGHVVVNASGGNGMLSYAFWYENRYYDNFFWGEFDFPAGNIIMEVIDSLGCKETIEIEMTQPDAISIDNLDVQHVSCYDGNDGSISLSALGGTGQLAVTIDGESVSFPTFENLGAGVKDIGITDENLCVLERQVEILEPEELMINPMVTTDTGFKTGSLELVISGGTLPYQVKLNDGEYVEETIFNDLPNGNYVISILDNNGCLTSIESEITFSTAVVDIGTIAFCDKSDIVGCVEQLLNDGHEDIHLQVFNLGGSIVKSLKVSKQNSRYLELHDLPSSIYIVRLQVDRWTRHYKYLHIR